MAGADGSDLSWSLGPENSRLVRTLLYLAEAIVGGAIFAFVVVFTMAVSQTLSAGVALSVFAVFALVLLVRRVVPLFVAVRQTPTRRNSPEAWLWEQDWRWPVALATVVAAGLLAVDAFRSPGPDSNFRARLWAVLLPALVLWALAGFASSTGEVDPDALELSYHRGVSNRTLDLRLVTGLHRADVGSLAVVWLSVTPGADDRFKLQGAYVLPAAVADRAWPTFEAGLAADPPLSVEEIRRGRSLRRINRGIVAAAALLVALPVSAWAWLFLPAPIAALTTVVLVALVGSLGLTLAV